MIVTNSYRSRHPVLRALFFACTLLVSVASYAQSISTTDLSANYFRMGAGLNYAGAYRAIADSSQAVIYNPAGVAQQQGVMQATGDYAYIGEVSAHLYGVSVVDYQTSPQIAYGLSFHRFAPTIGGVKGNVNQTMLSLAYSLGKIIQLGVSGKGYWVNLDSPILQGPRGVDLDVGLLVRPLPILSFAVVGYNLARGDSIEEFPLMLGLGGAIHLDPHAKFSFDLVRSFNTLSTKKTNYNMGAQFRVAENIDLRGGFAFDNIADNNYYSTGVAFVGPKADLLFSFSQRLSPTAETYAVSAAFKF